MPYGTLLTDTIKSSTSGPVAFQNTSGTEVGTLCRAWVNFNGNSGASPVIRASFNVSSVVRNSTGNYTITFTNALTDANYAYEFSGGGASASGSMVYQGGTQTASALTYQLASTSAAQDASTQCVVFFR